MDWKETVMSLQAIQQLRSIGIMRCVEVAEAQAEISFKAGYEAKESEFEVARIALSEVYGNGHKAGIREVVEWIEKNILMNFGIVSVRTDEWQAKLKEWGIKEG